MREPDMQEIYSDFAAHQRRCAIPGCIWFTLRYDLFCRRHADQIDRTAARVLGADERALIERAGVTAERMRTAQRWLLEAGRRADRAAARALTEEVADPWCWRLIAFACWSLAGYLLRWVLAG